MKIFRIIIILLACLQQENLMAQSTLFPSKPMEKLILVNDSYACKDKCINDTSRFCAKKFSPYRFKLKQIIIPSVLIGVGVIGLKSDWVKYQNKEIRNELQENIDRKISIDDFSQYVPIVSVYGLNFLGIKSKHNLRDQTIISATAYAIMGATVNILKVTTKVERPDGSSRNSFPSGHAATAFMGAELLRREYQDTSPWIGVAGYAVAAGTGFFRMYNNRHWFTDVLAGAGIGIMSVKAAYWLYPSIARIICHKHPLKNAYLVPYYSKENKGLTCSITF